ncbi:ALP1-like protein [Tanacetum coccineum]
MLEAVASYDLWIWHAFFWVAGANNDLTVLNNSMLFDDLLDDIALIAPFEVNGVTFEKGYYLVDDIYPQWSSFVKSFSVANSEKNALFKRKQESARKDIERAFGVLQRRWLIICQPTRAWTINKLRRATTEPASSSGQPSAPKTSIVVNARRNNEKTLNILLYAIPDRHLLSFHDAQDAQSLWAAIKARFGAREELDSAYDRFQNIISMLELYDAKVSCEDANLKFLRSLPSVWHVVATMIRGQPGLDELDFDDLYNNLKVYEHELKGASSLNSQSIAFMSAEIKGNTSRQSTADDKSEIITKGYAQASSSKLKETLNSSFNLDEIICSFFAQQASMPETHDDEDLLQIDDDAMEEIDIRWQVAMITARIRKFMRKMKTIDLKPNIANRANGSKEKRIVSIEDSNSKALVAKDSQEDDWSIEIDADHVDLGQDGLGVFYWSEEADNAPVALALMATSSTDSSNSEKFRDINCVTPPKWVAAEYGLESVTS